MSDIVKEVEKVLREAINEKTELPDNVVYVTELSTCLRKSWFRRREPEKITPSMLMGMAVHTRLLSKLRDMLSNRSVDIEVPVKMNVDNVELKGKVDAIVDGIPVELKTSNVILFTHRLQAEYYSMMLRSESYIICIITETSNIICKQYSRSIPDDELINRLKKYVMHITSDTMPEPEKEMGCAWCQYKSICRGESKLDRFIQP